ncbi:MAG: manganese efflux pump [Ruminococcaceae bacterium]|nr:manganese efflux pump [Oscillospiraceae bacterium]
MGFWELFIIAVGLSMDAFAVSVCKGLSVSRVKLKHALICGVWFGAFQGLMPAIGYFLGLQFEKYIVSVDHWITFVLLGIIGFNMIREALSKEEEECSCNFGFKTMFLMAVATSIDALAVGITFALNPVNIILAVSLIAVTTFTLSAIGVKIGNIFGTRYKSVSELVGGSVLILIGLKILLEHLGVINF